MRSHPTIKRPSGLQHVLIALAVWVAGLSALSAAARADILIGLAAPGSGREQGTGYAMRRAAEAAIGNLNAQGGVLGEMLALVVADDQCSDAGAAAAAQAFVQKRVALVIGHPCARSALAAAQVYGPAGMLFIAPATRHPALTEKRAGKTIFRLSGRDDQQASAAAAWLMLRPGTGPFAVVHDKTAYSRGLATGIAAALVAKAQAPPLDLPITAGQNDYGSVIAKLKDVRPRAVFFAGYPSEADIIVTALRAAGVTAAVLGSDSLATAEFTQQRAARDAGVQVLSRFDPSVDFISMLGDGHASAAAAFDPAWSAPQTAGARHTVQAIFSWAAAAQRAASSAPEKVSHELEVTQPAMPAGTVAFSDRGDARVVSFYEVCWNGKTWVSGEAPRD